MRPWDAFTVTLCVGAFLLSWTSLAVAFFKERFVVVSVLGFCIVTVMMGLQIGFIVDVMDRAQS